MLQGYSGNIIWQSNTASNNSNLAPYKLELQNEGYISIINGNGNTIWTSDNNSPGTTTTTSSTTIATLVPGNLKRIFRLI